MRAAMLAMVILLSGCERQEPTAKDYALAKAYCEKYGLQARVSVPVLPPLDRKRIYCRAGDYQTVAVPEEVFTGSGKP